jgi:hypothetical protein
VSFLVVAFVVIFTACSLGVALYFGYVATTNTTSLRTVRSRLIASLSFSVWLCGLGLFWILYDATLPVFEFQGEIQSVQIRHSSSNHFSANIHIRTTAGGDIDVHSSDRSNFLRKGQLIRVRYRADTGELSDAWFYAADGSQQGVLHTTVAFQKAGTILIGLFCIWASIRTYRHDLKSFQTAPFPVD